MKKWCVLPAVLMLAACENGLAIPDLRGAIGGAEAAEPTVQLSDKQRFIAAIGANGGSISPANVGTILQQASLGADRSSELLIEMVDEGTLVEGAPGSDTLILAAGTDVGNGLTSGDALPTLN